MSSKPKFTLNVFAFLDRALPDFPFAVTCIKWTVGATAALLVGTESYIKYLQFTDQMPALADAPRVSEGFRKSAFDRMSRSYDDSVDRDEWWTRITSHRKKLIKKASGKVLEIGAGTGRNIQYYESDADVTVIDFSRDMLMQAREKALKHKRSVKILVMDALNMEFADNSFDTVVDTFGVCSFEDPVATLSEAVRVLKPGGKLLLLEHGESHWEHVMRYQANTLEQHVKKWGCYWNRPIEEIVRQVPGIEIESSKRKLLGTNFIIIARKLEQSEVEAIE